MPTSNPKDKHLSRWQRLCAALAPFEAVEPALEGMRWHLHLYHPSQEKIVPSVGQTWLMQSRRWYLSFLSKSSGFSSTLPLWYALHGSTPAHRLPFEAVQCELTRRGIVGQVVGPYPYETLPLSGGWVQIPIDIGYPEAGPGRLSRLAKKAKTYAPDIREALLEHELWSVEAAPSVRLLVDWIWNALRLDWNIAQRLHRSAPRVLVLGSDLGILRNPLTRHARAMGAYTLVLQHGLQGEYAGSVASDEVSLWGEYHRRHTVALGAPPEKLVVDGSPRMDGMLKQVGDPDMRLAARNKLGISPETPVFIHISEGAKQLSKIYPEIAGRFWQDAAVAFGKIGREAVYLLRPHPGESGKEWQELGLQGSLRVVTNQEAGFNELIAAADVVTTILSAGGLEAIWCKRPVLFYQPSGIPPVHDFIDAGGGLAVQDAQEWVEAALTLARDPEARRQQIEASAAFCADTLAYPGQAAGRVADRIIAHMN